MFELGIECGGAAGECRRLFDAHLGPPGGAKKPESPNVKASQIMATQGIAARPCNPSRLQSSRRQKQKIATVAILPEETAAVA